MTDIVGGAICREMSPRAQRVLRNMVESATTPSKSYKVRAASGGFVIYRPDLQTRSGIFSLRPPILEADV
jgi:hypothetical protein